MCFRIQLSGESEIKRITPYIFIMSKHHVVCMISFLFLWMILYAIDDIVLTRLIQRPTATIKKHQH